MQLIILDKNKVLVKSLSQFKIIFLMMDYFCIYCFFLISNIFGQYYCLNIKNKPNEIFDCKNGGNLSFNIILSNQF